MAIEDAAEKINPENIEKPPEKAKSPEEIWSGKYWEDIRERGKNPEEAEKLEKATKSNMKEALALALKEGKLDISVSDKELTDEDRKKIFAYSKLAKDNKYKIGPFKLDESGAKTSAEISKGREKVVYLNKYKERISDLFSKEGGEIGTEKAAKLAIEVAHKQFQSWKDKYKGLDLNPKEMWAKLDDKKILGMSVKNLLGSMAAGSAARFIVRTVSGVSGGMLVGASAGALGNGAWEAIKAYTKEKERLSKMSVRDKILERAKDINEKNIGLKAKVDEYFELIEKEEPFPDFEQMSERRKSLHQELIKELKFESVKSSKVLKGFGKGAITGAIGGAFGGWIGEHLNNYFHGPSEATAAIKDFKKSAGSEAYSHMQERISDTFSKTFEGARAEGLAGLGTKEFFAMADKGDSLTTMSRNLIHDYISQKQALGVEIALDKSQLIYAEDALKNLFKGRALSSGDELSLLGEQINSAIEKAQLLTSVGKEHIKTEYASKIGDKVWEQVTNYDSPFHSENNFSKEILKQSSDKGITFIHDSAQGLGADIAQRVADKGKNRAAASVVEKARDSWLESFLSVTGAAYAGEYGTKGRLKEFADKLRKRKAPKTPEHEYRHADDFNEGDSDLRPDQKLAENVSHSQAGKNEMEDIIEHPEIDERLQKIGTIPDGYLDEDEKIKPEEKAKPKPETKPKKEKVEKRISDDPMFKYFEEKDIVKHFGIKPEEIGYKVITPIREETFSTYKSMRNWFEHELNESQRSRLIERDLDRTKKPVIKMILPPRLEKFLKANELNRASFNAEVDRIIKHMFGVREDIPNEKKEIPPEKEKDFEEFRGSKIGNEAPYPPESEHETILRIEEEENLRAGDIRGDLVKGLGEEIKAERITRESLEEERRNFRKEEVKDPEIEKFGSMTPDELDEEELRLRYDQDKDKANGEKYEKLYEKINFIRESRKNAA